MVNEVHRQLIHISGILFVIIAQFIPTRVAAITFAIIALMFFIYAELIRREHNRFLRTLRFFERDVRKFALRFERPHTRPFLGATFFYLSAAIVFAIAALPIASAAITILAVGDGFATLIGVRFGVHKAINNKSFEGTISFFITALLAATILVPLHIAAAGALVGALVELAVPANKRYRVFGIDDNLLIPLAAALVMSLIAI